MSAVVLVDQLETAEELRLGREQMETPQDLPGRYGKAVRAVDRVLAILGGSAVVAGGWAVWRHGYVGRVTQDLDIALAAAEIDEFLRVASMAGFEVYTAPPGRWPKLMHKETGIDVDVLPEGGRPGIPSRLAPTTIPHPRTMGAAAGRLNYISLPKLIELKLAAGRIRDDNDVVELLRANPDDAAALRAALPHPDYVRKFDALAARAAEEQE